MKVYCKNCKYFKESMILDRYYKHTCTAPTGKIIKNYVYGDSKELINKFVGGKSYPNKNGKCEYYKKKWWKIF